MLDIFEIIGPVMVGPSSSHTAGAVRIGNMARKLLGGEPQTAQIYLHGSFAETGKGHGTDKALIAGLLGFATDDTRIIESFSLAREAGLAYSFQKVNLREAHPNTVILDLKGADGRQLRMEACSTGGGRILVHMLDGIQVDFTGEYHTLIVYCKDESGQVAEVTEKLSESKVNIANMRLRRKDKGGQAIMVIEVDHPVPETVKVELESMKGIQKVVNYEREDA